MKLEQKKGQVEGSPRVILQEGDQTLEIKYSANWDLYWTLRSPNVDENNCFMVTKENYGVYRLFDQLFRDLEDINVFGEIEVPFYMQEEDEEAIRNYIREQEKSIESQKKKYRKNNESHYNELYDKDKKTITWYSDETHSSVANYLRITKLDETFKVEFFTQPHIKGYDKDFHSTSYITVRFRNSGSTYDPFNTVFMRMYKGLCEVDDVNNFGHQVHMEEWYYKVKTKKLVPPKKTE